MREQGVEQPTRPGSHVLGVDGGDLIGSDDRDDTIDQLIGPCAARVSSTIHSGGSSADREAREDRGDHRNPRRAVARCREGNVVHDPEE